MSPLVAEQVVLGLTMIVCAVFFGRWLYLKGRREPNSAMVNTSVLADFMCVAEVTFVVVGPMLLLRALLTAF